MCKAERRPSGGDGKISCKDKYCQLFETSKRKHYFSVLNLGSKNNSLNKKVTVNKMLMTVIRTGCKLKSDGISGGSNGVSRRPRKFLRKNIHKWWSHNCASLHFRAGRRIGILPYLPLTLITLHLVI